MSIYKIFITGANGFIGSHLLERLLQDEKNQVTILLRANSDTSRISNFLGNKNLTQIDIAGLETYFQENPPHIVLHLATCYKKFHSTSDIEEMISSNITFPTQLAQLCVTYKVNYFINTGSFFEYDFSDIPLHETSREKAFNLYASTKLAFNDILKYYTQQYNFYCLTLRLFSPYGPKDNEKLIPVAIQSLMQNKVLNIQNNTQRLNFTYVDDIIDAYLLAIEKIESFQNKYDVVNIAPPDAISIKTVLDTLQEVAHQKIDIHAGDANENDIWHSSFQSSYALELLNWQAKTPLSQGLLQTLNYYKGQL